MTIRGRRPKPTAQKKLDGNPGRRPMNPNEPEMPAVLEAFDQPPSELADEPLAADEWRRIAPMLRKSRTVTEADRSALLSLCQQWGRYLEANSKIRLSGMVIKSPSGYPMPNPYIGISNKTLNNCMKLWGELGLTPSSRSRVQAEGPGPGGDAFSEFDDAGGGEGLTRH